MPNGHVHRVFVQHGALCIAYSRLVVRVLNHRDGNEGTAPTPCRWDYKICALERTTRAEIRWSKSGGI